MNYADFYTSAEKVLIDSLVSLWLRGKAKEQAYMRQILSKDEPLMAEPVFQSIFPWESSKETFGEHATKLHILSPSFVEALGSDKVDEEMRFPLSRCPYKHQTKSWKTMLSGEGKTIVVTSGTGSGKTECFMIPVLQDIANRNEKDCVQAIFLYPLNALMKSQQKRIHAWCNALPNKITYAIYNGDTEKNKRTESFTSKFFPQLVTRPQIRETPPQVLFTNPTMLNYMLVRAEDKAILEKSKGKLKWILLDEAHTYTGSSAAELSLQLRRVLDAFGVTIEQVNFAVTSATIGDEDDPAAEQKLKTFVSQLTGKPTESIVVIGGKRIIPEMDAAKATEAIESVNAKYGTKISLADIERLRKKLNTNPVLSTKQIAKLLDSVISKDTVKSLEVINALGDKVDGLNKADGGKAALLPSRIHYFVRSINGVYACVNPECSRHKKIRLGIGSLTTYQNTNCPVCKSKMLEVATCPSCGGLIVVGENSTSEGFRMHVNTVDLDNGVFFDADEDLIESEGLSADDGRAKKEAAGYTPFYFAKPSKPCLRHHTHVEKHVFNHEKNKIEIALDDADKATVFESLRHSDNNKDLCPYCGNSLGHVNYLRASATQMGRALATTILDNAEGVKNTDSEILYKGKKYITFTDNRQGSARTAMGLNQDVERAWIRASIFHKMADMRLERIEPSGLTDEEKQTYQYLSTQPKEALPPFLLTELERLEAKKSGKQVVPAPPEVSFGEISTALENNTDFRKLYKHINEARGGKGAENTTVYLRALLIDQFGWIPKRANSMETMGFVRLVYPDLKKAKCPEALLAKDCKDEDWQDFLKICIDYVIRGGRHYMMAGDVKPYLTQNIYMSEIYPKDSDKRVNGKPVSKWPVVKQRLDGTVQDDQNRLVLLLCAVLGYNDAEQIDVGKVAIINSLLDKAWGFLTSNILDPVDTEDKGYMLDLIGKKVKLQLIEKGYLCPVDNVVVDVTFKGYSPRINGYIGRENFERFKVATTFDYPYFPFKSTELDGNKINAWIDENLSSQKEYGVYTELHERVYAQKPIFISAEHSAQQSREDLDKYEKEFNEGHLNVLSCSTTMEMGVDIGGISEVVMNNVPPKSANYLQRAGRAGRRSESKALALTFCAPNPIGANTWKHPDYPITHLTETPLLKLESRQLIQRHVNAMVFADFVSLQGGIRVTAKLEDFFVPNDGLCYFDKFLNHIDSIIGGNRTDLDASYKALVRGTALDNIPLSDAVFTTKKDITAVRGLYQARIDSLDKTIKLLEEEDGNSAALRSVQYQKDNFLSTSLLTYMAEHSFLPSAGIPTGLVQCVLGKNNEENSPTMHLSQAISAYAPGKQVVKNEWIYQPAGILMKTKYDDNTTRYVLQNCTHCGYTVIRQGNVLNDCPKCGKENSMHGIKDMSISTEQRFTEVVEPVAFSVAFGSKPTRKMNAQGEMSFVQPVLLKMDPWQEKTSAAKMVLRCSTNESEILFFNRGRSTYGFAFCPYCGRMEYEQSPDCSENVLAGHKHLSTGLPCPGGEANGRNIRRHVLLVGRYQTDFVEVKFYDAANVLVRDSETLYSLGVILSRKLTELLGVNDGEIDFGYNEASHSIFIYDTALGGAGYSPLFREYKDKVLENAYEALTKCDCERSCTKCLIDRRSQWYINYLNRQKALEWLEMERNSRVAPESIVSDIPDASAVTTDFATEFYQLTRNDNVKSLKVFVDNEYDSWQLDDFSYGKLLSELSLSGVDVAYVLNKNIQLSSCSASSKAILMAALFKNKFEYVKVGLKESLKPLLAVTFSDGTSKMYFGENVDVSLNANWGDGDVFSSLSNIRMEYVPINPSDILAEMNADDGSIMFDARILEDCRVNNLCEKLMKYKSEKWDRIIPSMRGKNVSVTYSDRYLVTPLGCILLAHFIADVQQKLQLNIVSLNIYVKKPNGDAYGNQRIGLEREYGDNVARNSFMEDAIREIAGITPEIVDYGYIEHERCMSIKTADEELCIRPDAGIAHGWNLFGRSNSDCTDDDFRYDWDMDVPLYNKKKNYSGILYTISYNKL
uniref:DEAD/DEAH box helicase n=1 Tax=Prevotella sp. TaxID=59823 RepID=UPI004026D7A5